MKGLGLNTDAVKSPLRYASQKWSGEKMLIIPSLIEETIDRNLVVTKFSEMETSKFGMIALVPSTKYCKQYQLSGANIATSKNIFNELDTLKKGNFSKLVVINNRYDGIDLPDESCRILILDGLPYFDSLTDRYEVQACPQSELINKRIAQKIEQGIGRGVRGEKDYCAVLIIGSELIRFMQSIATNKFFSAQTRKQIEIGLELTDLAKADCNKYDFPLDVVVSLINQMLERDEGWKEYYISTMDSIEDDYSEGLIYKRLLKEYQFERLFSDGEYEKAQSKMQDLINESTINDAEKGWYLQQLARYTYPTSIEKSNQIQKSAFKLNSQLLKPRTGIIYSQVSYINENRLNNIRKYLLKYPNYEELALAMKVILDNLSFGIEAKKFESALKEIGDLLGYISQRPDNEIGKGPDNLWCGVNNHYLLFECKSQVSENRSSISKTEAGQMNNHCAWFDNQYGTTVRIDRFMIIPTKQLSFEGDCSHKVRIIRKNKLRNLKNNIKNFIEELRPYNLNEILDETIQKLLDLYHLNVEEFYEKYSEEYYHQKKPIE